MAHLPLDAKGRFSSRFAYLKIEPIEGIDLPPIVRDHSAGSSEASIEIPPLTQQIYGTISTSEPCFITKRPGYDMVNFFFITLGDMGYFQKGMECFLYKLGLVPEQFKLNSVNNMVLLDQSLERILSHFGFFAITCSKATLKAMIKLVKKENRKPGSQRRQFNLMEPPFSDATYEMVVLYPHHFLPNGSTLPIYTRNTEGHLDYKTYIASDDGALREGREPTSPRFSAFSNPNEFRATQHHLNPFLVVLNAEMIFRRFKRTNPNLEECLCADYCKLVKLTLQLADEIYHWEHLKHAYASYEMIVYQINREDSLLNDIDEPIYDHWSNSDDLDPDSVDFADDDFLGGAEMIAEAEAEALAVANDDDCEIEETEELLESSIEKVLEWQASITTLREEA